MELFTLENLFTLLMLTLLQAVLGFDNLLYISMESKRAPVESQQYVRRLGVAIAILLRIVLLFALIRAIGAFQTPFVSLDTSAVHVELNGHALIVLVGGGFIMWTAVKEIFHMLAPRDLDDPGDGERSQRSVGGAIFWIVVMNLVFSFDSILSAMALTSASASTELGSPAFIVMATAIVISGVLMIWLADRVAVFLERNRMWEVLGLFVLLLVGVMLLSEGGHLAHLEFFGYPVEPMAKSTFYFVIAVLVVVDVVQGRYKRNLLAEE